MEPTLLLHLAVVLVADTRPRNNLSFNKTPRFVEGVEFTTTTPGSTNHTPFLLKFNYLLSIEFYKEGSIVNMRIEKWGIICVI